MSAGVILGTPYSRRSAGSHPPLAVSSQGRGALIELANPRHQHEYAVLKRYPLPDSMLFMPGVIDTTTNYVEHPEMVANRLYQAVDVVGDRAGSLPAQIVGLVPTLDGTLWPECGMGEAADAGGRCLHRQRSSLGLSARAANSPRHTGDVPIHKKPPLRAIEADSHAEMLLLTGMGDTPLRRTSGVSERCASPARRVRG